MPKWVRQNRPIERAAVNATRPFFDRHSYIFTDVPIDNDVGKDAYVDIVDKNIVAVPGS
jgi:hypothetical protein